MKAEDLEDGTVSELSTGTEYTGPNGQRLILGDTDTVAYQDADGGWQVAENVTWERVEYFSGAMESARNRVHHMDLVNLAEAWAKSHGTDTYEGIYRDIREFRAEQNGAALTEDDLDTVCGLLEGAKIVFE